MAVLCPPIYPPLLPGHTNLSGAAPGPLRPRSATIGKGAPPQLQGKTPKEGLRDPCLGQGAGHSFLGVGMGLL